MADVEHDEAVADLATDKDLLAWVARSFVPQLRALIDRQSRLAAERSTFPLQQRIRELEAELAKLRAAVARAAQDHAA
jgi:hypothetical protein